MLQKLSLHEGQLDHSLIACSCNFIQLSGECTFISARALPSCRQCLVSMFEASVDGEQEDAAVKP